MIEEILSVPYGIHSAALVCSRSLVPGLGIPRVSVTVSLTAGRFGGLQEGGARDMRLNGHVRIYPTYCT